MNILGEKMALVRTMLGSSLSRDISLPLNRLGQRRNFCYRPIGALLMTRRNAEITPSALSNSQLLWQLREQKRSLGHVMSLSDYDDKVSRCCTDSRHFISTISPSSSRSGVPLLEGPSRIPLFGAPVRWRANRTFGGSKRPQREEQSDDEDDEEEEEEDEDDDEPVDISLAKNETSIGGESKTVTKQFALLRADYVIMHVLNLDRDGFANIFYEGRITLNKLLLAKKSTRLSRGDCIDILQPETESTPKDVTVVKRIMLTDVQRVAANKVKCEMEYWKPGIRIKREET